MGLSFRPVREDWGPSSDAFIGSENLAALLTGVAYDAGGGNEQLDYGQDVTALHIESGAKFLDVLASDKFTVETAKTTLCDMLSGLEEVPEDDLAALVGNIKSMVEPWRRSIGSDGELRFYIDNF